jgi:hypothetical protein
MSWPSFKTSWLVTVKSALLRIVIASAIVVGVSADARAQLKGHYIAGFTGLENGSQPPPSITVAVPASVDSTAQISWRAGAFFLPSGEWELGGTENSGLGMWSNDFQAGTTVRLDNKREWSTSAVLTYEIHSEKKDADLKTGDIITIEGGTGRAFYELVNGTPIPQITNIGVPKPKLLLGAGVLPEFGARNRKQRLTFPLTVGYQAKSLVRAAAQP